MELLTPHFVLGTLFGAVLVLILIGWISGVYDYCFEADKERCPRNPTGRGHRYYKRYSESYCVWCGKLEPEGDNDGQGT